MDGQGGPQRSQPQADLGQIRPPLPGCDFNRNEACGNKPLRSAKVFSRLRRSESSCTGMGRGKKKVEDGSEAAPARGARPGPGSVLSSLRTAGGAAPGARGNGSEPARWFCGNRGRRRGKLD